MISEKSNIISALKKDILPLQGFKNLPTDNSLNIGFRAIEKAFPNSIFPIGCLHEFINSDVQNVASSNGFIAALMSKFLLLGGACLWISTSRTIFPASLKYFGVNPEQIIFIDLKKERDVLYATEEALKCNKLTAVLSEVKNIGFKESRRLQLAAEKSRVTGFIIRQAQSIHTIASISKWRITSLPSELDGAMPGVGFPRWNVELLRVRNGTPNNWQIEWISNQFVEVKKNIIYNQHELRKIS
jgi:protein ImuA